MLRQTIVYPDAEQVLVTHLRGLLATRVEDFAENVTVGTRMPTAAPGRYLLVRRVGGVAPSLVVDAARIDIMCWHDGDASRVALTQLVRGMILGLEGRVVAGVPCARVAEFAGPINMPDPVDDTRTVTMFTHEVRLRGQVS